MKVVLMNMNKYPKISIVTPSYNQGQFIEDTIISILGQGYPNLEYIVMDGGSTDNTVDILKKYDAQITYWQSEKDTGQSNAINSGFGRATGDILLWLNSDDMLLPNSLFYMVEQVKKGGDGIYFGNTIHFKEENRYTWALGSDVIGKHRDNNIKDFDFVIQPSSWWTKRVWEETGLLNEDIHFVFDWEWFIRADAKFSFFPQEKVLSMYRFHANHKTGSGSEKRQLEYLDLLNKYGSKRAELYDLMMYETDTEYGFWGAIKIRYYKLMNRMKGDKLSYAMRLKKGKKRKYKKYTVNEIQKILEI